MRELFDIPADVTYLNCANMSPLLRSVSDASARALSIRGAPWKLSSADWFTGAETLRDVAARVFGTTSDSIALVPSASYALAIASANIPVEKGQSIVLVQGDFPSNVYAWRDLTRRRQDTRIRTVPRGQDGTWTQSVLGAIDSTTAVVAVPHCHWTDGAIIDLELVSDKARAVGAALVIDASQSLGALPIDLARIQPDFLASVGYKWLLGPYALGYLYVSPRWQTQGRPIENSWLNRAGSEDFSSLVDYRDEYRPGARRFDMGEFPNFETIPMAIAALQQIHQWGVERIQRSLRGLTDLIADRAAEMGCTCAPPEGRAGHLIGIRFPAGVPQGAAQRLAEARIYVSLRGDAIRIAPHLYNDEGDIEKLFAVLRTLI